MICDNFNLKEFSMQQLNTLRPIEAYALVI